MNAIAGAMSRFLTDSFSWRARAGKTIQLAGVTLAFSVGLLSVEAVNIAPEGTGIIGVNDTIDSDAGTPHASAGEPGNINDGNPLTRVDNWWGAAPGDGGQVFSYVGIQWPWKRFDPISSLTLTMATFLDGGWFGVSGFAPAPGTDLWLTDLIEPVVQISTDFGVTWSEVACTSDYMDVFEGHLIGGGDQPNPTSATAVFTLNAPVQGITSVRIIGENGGMAGADPNGFIGVFELEVEAQASSDSDGDGLPDVWEEANGLTVGTDDSAGDPDGDGLDNTAEFNHGTHPNNADTDGDGLSDPDELFLHGTNPLMADTDGDGVSDQAEVVTHGTDPLRADTDGDGLSDGRELTETNTNPLIEDTDADRFGDGLEVELGHDPNDIMDHPSNIARLGTPIMGVNDGVDWDNGIPHVNGAEVAWAINDGDLNTQANNWFPGDTHIVSYAGIEWTTPITLPVQTLTLTFATFTDGGWFGLSGFNPGAGSFLLDTDLIEPTIQATDDHGQTWMDVGHTSNYFTALDGHGIGGGGNPNPTSVTAVFELTTPPSRITGLRIIGENGGMAGADANGFLGVFELELEAAVTVDTDGDGMEDVWEVANGLSVGTNDAALDPDDDGLTNLQEFKLGTDPHDEDADMDGLPDGEEVFTYNTFPQNADSDGDGLNDGDEVFVHGTDPRNADSDGDGLSDGDEVDLHNSNPLVTDTDGDLFPDAIEVRDGTDPASAQSKPTNIASLGVGILGTKESIATGPSVPLFNAGIAAHITDGNMDTRVDTYNATTPSTASYVGILWDTMVPSEEIDRLVLDLAIFFDGGWFGVNNVSPGSGGALDSATHLVEPVVQVTDDHGATWTTVDYTSDYLTALDGHPLPAVDFGPPTRATATFTPTGLSGEIDGIRIIGTEGGVAGGTGFLGVFQLAVHLDYGSGGEQVRIESVGVVSGEFQFRFQSVAGAAHHIEWAESPEGPWEEITTITGIGNLATVSQPAVASQRFFRVRTEP